MLKSSLFFKKTCGQSLVVLAAKLPKSAKIGQEKIGLSDTKKVWNKLYAKKEALKKVLTKGAWTPLIKQNIKFPWTFGLKHVHNFLNRFVKCDIFLKENTERIIA